VIAVLFGMLEGEGMGVSGTLLTWGYGGHCVELISN
jgi:hypothetical protein